MILAHVGGRVGGPNGVFDALFRVAFDLLFNHFAWTLTVDFGSLSLGEAQMSTKSSPLHLGFDSPPKSGVNFSEDLLLFCAALCHKSGRHPNIASTCCAQSLLP